MRYIFSYLFFAFLICAWATSDDFECARDAYEQGHYTAALVYLKNFLEENPFDTHIPDAEYYLVRIYDHKKDFLNLISHAHRFLENHRFDYRCQEVFNLLLERLSEHNTFSLALEYIKNYDYLISDCSVLGNVGYGLFKQGRSMLADYVFSLCPQTDTIKILRAQLLTDPVHKKKIYESIPGPKGKIYQIEHLLEIGDTLGAFEIYRQLEEKQITENILFRYAKVSHFFNKSACRRLTQQLVQIATYRNKALLLKALNSGYLDELITPLDEEECTLLIEYLKQDTVPRNPPDSIDIHSITSDSLAKEKLYSIRKQIGDNYYLDSTYCEMIIAENRVVEAFAIIVPYLEYHNVANYVRQIRALKYYGDGKYELAANDIILSNNQTSEMKLLLANCLANLGKDASALYEEIIESSKDSLLTSQALKGLINIKFKHGEYLDIAQQHPDAFKGDTNLIKVYVYSLARSGSVEKADSIFRQFSTEPDYNLANYYGEYLVDNKYYTKAAYYYDSIIRTEASPPENLYYNWALTSFLQGEIDTAFNRFRFYIGQFKNEQNYYNALFKIATIHYLKQEFDSAGYYYGLASKDNLLQHDALRNQLICYKKSENWQKAINIGMKMLSFVSGDEESEIQFELGYALLRFAKLRQAIDHLKRAVGLTSIPEHHYWLAEAYLAKGDFIRALYRYQKIVNLFTGDEMWAPTAQYKTGIVFEFMDELDEAKRIYQLIIKTRGLGDTWGAEAQKRLEAME